MIELLVGTTNQGKLAEIEGHLQRFSLTLLPLQSLGRWPSLIEDGATFEQNALKKARTLAAYCGLLTLADDSGLVVDALNGAPGIFSARYAGEESNDARNNEKLLLELKDIPEQKRSARFVCVLALCAPASGHTREWVVREQCEGRIAFAAKGENGFGYDPLFFYPPLDKTFGEIDREAKAKVSHRGKALEKLAGIMSSLFNLSSKT
jgi:XTP/dITP diphosphohydrolase